MITRNVQKPASFRKRDSSNGVEYEYTRTIVVNSPNDNELTIARVVPTKNSLFVYRGQTQICTDLETSQVERLVWEARVTFAPYNLATKPPQPKDPIRWPVEIEWDDRVIETYPLVDLDNQPYINSAGDPLKDRPAEEISHPILTITRWQSTYSALQMANFANRMNSSAWYACPPKTAKCFFPRAALTWVEDAKGYFWKVTYKFEIAPETWVPKIADMGKRCLVDETFTSMSGGEHKTGKKVKASCRDAMGEPSQDGEFLDGKGGQLDFEKVKKGAVEWIPPHRNLKMADFNQLRLV
jgi:hypothetical protein